MTHVLIKALLKPVIIAVKVTTYNKSIIHLFVIGVILFLIIHSLTRSLAHMHADFFILYAPINYVIIIMLTFMYFLGHFVNVAILKEKTEAKMFLASSTMASSAMSSNCQLQFSYSIFTGFPSLY